MRYNDYEHGPHSLLLLPSTPSAMRLCSSCHEEVDSISESHQSGQWLVSATKYSGFGGPPAQAILTSTLLEPLGWGLADEPGPACWTRWGVRPHLHHSLRWRASPWGDSRAASSTRPTADTSAHRPGQDPVSLASWLTSSRARRHVYWF